MPASLTADMLMPMGMFIRYTQVRVHMAHGMSAHARMS